MVAHDNSLKFFFRVILIGHDGMQGFLKLARVYKIGKPKL